MTNDWPEKLTNLREDDAFLRLLQDYVAVRARHREAMSAGADRDRMVNLDGARRAAHNRAAQYLVDQGQAPALADGRELVKQCANALSE